MAREIVARGHEVGCHTMHHLDHHEVEPQQAVQDLLEGAQILERLLGVAPQLYRAPYGRFLHKTVAEASRHGMTSVLWSAWGIDWLPDDAETIAARVFEDFGKGAIVLLHDSARYAHDRDDCTPTIEATGLVLREANPRGLQPVTVGQLLATE
jgi:peptidoglycan/xylan/chitin deacetylase (PgdA/CDA1 family)